VVEYDVSVEIVDTTPGSVTAIVDALAATVTASGFESDIGSDLVAAVPSLPTLTPAVVVAPTTSSVTTVITRSASPTSAPTIEATFAQLPVTIEMYIIGCGSAALVAMAAYLHHHHTEAQKMLARINPKPEDKRAEFKALGTPIEKGSSPTSKGI